MLQQASSSPFAPFLSPARSTCSKCLVTGSSSFRNKLSSKKQEGASLRTIQQNRLMTNFTKDSLEPDPERDAWFRRALEDPHVRVRRTLMVCLPKSTDEAGMLLNWVGSNLARTGDRVEGFFCASGEPSTAIEHTFSLTPGGFTTHEVTPPSVPGRALSHEVEQWSRDLLDAYALRLFDAGVAVSLHVRPISAYAETSYIGHAICDKAEAVDADVIVISSHHKKQPMFSRWLSGSVADYVLQNCPRPICILGSEEGRHAAAGGIQAEASAGRQLMIAVDGSADSFVSLQWVLQHMHRAADVIRLCHVVPVLSLTVDGGLTGGASMETLAKAKQEQDDWQHVKIHVFEDLIQSAAAKYSMDTITEAADNPTNTIADAICRKADEIDASIICLAAHHNSSFSEFVVGSVSNRVAEHATAKPVCVIKGHKVDSIAESRGIIV